MARLKHGRNGYPKIGLSTSAPTAGVRDLTWPTVVTIRRMWPPAALNFLRELEDNNDRDWFKANRARYDRDLLAPARALAEKLEPLGPPHFFRPYNNTR